MDILIAIVASLILIPIVLFTSGILRIILTPVFVFVIIGYLLVAALFPRKTNLSGVERLALSIGLSIAVVALICLVLNYLPWGIQTTSLLVTMPLFCLIMAGIAFFRRSRLPPAERYELNIQFKPGLLLKSWNGYRKTEKALTILLVVVVLTTSIVFIYVIGKPNTGQKFTEFYFDENINQTGAYQKTFYLGDSGHITVAIVNHEYKTVVYKIEVTVNGDTVNNYGPISLDHLEKWEQELSFPLVRLGNDQPVEFLLFKGEDNTTPQKLRLVINVNE